MVCWKKQNWEEKHHSVRAQPIKSVEQIAKNERANENGKAQI